MSHHMQLLRFLRLSVVLGPEWTDGWMDGYGWICSGSSFIGFFDTPFLPDQPHSRNVSLHKSLNKARLLVRSFLGWY